MRRDVGLRVPNGASPELIAFAKEVEQFIIDREKQPKLLPAYTVAELNALDPADWTDCVVICTDEHGGRCLAESTGLIWAHCVDGVAVW